MFVCQLIAMSELNSLGSLAIFRTRFHSNDSMREGERKGVKSSTVVRMKIVFVQFLCRLNIEHLWSMLKPWPKYQVVGWTGERYTFILFDSFHMTTHSIQLSYYRLLFLWLSWSPPYKWAMNKEHWALKHWTRCSDERKQRIQLFKFNFGKCKVAIKLFFSLFLSFFRQQGHSDWNNVLFNVLPNYIFLFIWKAKRNWNSEKLTIGLDDCQMQTTSSVFSIILNLCWIGKVFLNSPFNLSFGLL